MDRIKLHKVKGFTLLELLIVMAIIGVLAAIIIPNTVSRIRDSKIESVNSKAQEVFTACQNYLTDCQIKRIPLTYEVSNEKSPAFPINGKKTLSSGHNVISIIYYGALSKDIYNISTLSSVAYSSDNHSASTTWGFSSAIGGSGTDGSALVASGSLTTDEVQKIADKSISGISSYLGSSMTADTTGAFGFIIDVDTYTVLRAWYSENESAYQDVLGIANLCITGSGSVGNADKYGVGAYFTQIFGKTDNTDKTLRSQEIATINSETVGGGTSAYVGQYPIGE